MRKILLVIHIFCVLGLYAQENPQNIQYTRIYDFVDELANNKVIDINSHIKPYSRHLIAEKLLEAQAKDSLLNERQKKELTFFLNDYALECDTVPTGYVKWTDGNKFTLSLFQPAFSYRQENNNFKMRVVPYLGMDIYTNKKGSIIHRYYGAELSADIMQHVAVWGSFRDHSYNGNHLKSSYFPNRGQLRDGARLSKAGYLNTLPGCEYKEADYGGDFSDVRGGISAYASWGSISLVKDNLEWGDNYHGSNVISGRAPSFPMISLKLTPCKWFQLDYIHGWLVSNQLDSTNYYVEEYNDGDEIMERRQYRPRNKFIAANMMTFKPIKGLSLSLGNSIIYAENSVHAAFFIPIGYYKSIDHMQTKGLGTENQNSQIFFNVSSRNLKHVHLYCSMYIDEFKRDRLKKNNPERNLFSYKVGTRISDFPLNNLSLTAEFTRNNIMNYKHSIQALTFASNSYCLGSYMGDNSQELYLALQYKPIRGMDITLSYVNAVKFNDYKYLRKDVGNAIAQKPFNEKVWKNDEISLDVLYELFNNVYLRMNLAYNNARGYDRSAKKDAIVSENCLIAQQFLDKFTPRFYQGENFSAILGVNIGF